MYVPFFGVKYDSVLLCYHENEVQAQRTFKLLANHNVLFAAVNTFSRKKKTTDLVKAPGMSFHHGSNKYCSMNTYCTSFL